MFKVILFIPKDVPAAIKPFGVAVVVYIHANLQSDN